MNQNNRRTWETVSMYCPNCATLNTGYKDEEGRVKFQCMLWLRSLEIYIKVLKRPLIPLHASKIPSRGLACNPNLIYST